MFDWFTPEIWDTMLDLKGIMERIWKALL